jgi:hypothetical protein
LTIIIVFGAVGNIISMIVWRYGKRSCTASCRRYMWSLALNVLVLLLMVVGTGFTLYESNIYILRTSFIVCKLLFFLCLFLPPLSAWITVAFAFERTLSVCFPIRVNKISVERRSYLTLCLIVLFSFGLNCFELFSPETLCTQITQGNSSEAFELPNSYYHMVLISYGLHCIYISNSSRTFINE